MFGISPLGWLHTLGSLPAIPLAIYMLARHGRIVPRSGAGVIYFVCMVIGSLSVFLVAKQPASNVIAVITLVLLMVGYGVGHVSRHGRVAVYFETISLSLTVFLLLVPSVSETLMRVPDGHPIASGPNSPILLGALGSLVIMLVILLATQIIHLRRQGRTASAIAARW